MVRRYQKTISCPKCGTKHVLRARETNTGWTVNFTATSRGHDKKMCQCGHLISIKHEDSPLYGRFV